MAADQKWELHPQLAQDTLALGDLQLSRVLLSRDSNYPWLIVVPRRAGVVELIDLPEAEQSGAYWEISKTARALKSATGCDKLNIGAMGNMGPQLNIHLVARSKTDAAWPKPPWSTLPGRPNE